jgi:hypothetical protein
MKKYLMFMMCLLFGVCLVCCEGCKNEGGTRTSVPKQEFTVKIGELLEIVDVRLSGDKVVIKFKNATTGVDTGDIYVPVCAEEIEVTTNELVKIGQLVDVDGSTSYTLSYCLFKDTTFWAISFIVGELSEPEEDIFNIVNQKSLIKLYESGKKAFSHECCPVLKLNNNRAECIKSVKIQKRANSYYFEGVLELFKT